MQQPVLTPSQSTLYLFCGETRSCICRIVATTPELIVEAVDVFNDKVSSQADMFRANAEHLTPYEPSKNTTGGFLAKQNELQEIYSALLGATMDNLHILSEASPNTDLSRYDIRVGSSIVKYISEEGESLILEDGKIIRSYDVIFDNPLQDLLVGIERAMEDLKVIIKIGDNIDEHSNVDEAIKAIADQKDSLPHDVLEKATAMAELLRYSYKPQTKKVRDTKISMNWEVCEDL